MNNRWGRWLALAGLLLAALLVGLDGVGPILALLGAAGVSLVAAALFHIVPMALNAAAWRVLFPRHEQPSWAAVFAATWVRESVNGLLPVARVGGEIAGVRMLATAGRHVGVAAALLVDMVVCLFSQGVFCLVGVALLVGTHPATPLALQLVVAVVLLFGISVGLAVFQRSGVAARLIGWADRQLADRWPAVFEQSARIDAAARDIYGQRRGLMNCLGLQLLGCLAGAAEVWIALRVLGHPATPVDAVILESVVQAIGSIAFIVPGALGVQEGGFLLVGAALGIDGPTALALAAVRRLRDLLIFFPGLWVWHAAESRRQGPAAAAG